MIRKIQIKLFCSCFFILCLQQGYGQEEKAEGHDAQELADKLANPVANMISIPLQNNIDYGIGPNNGSKYTLNVQPVIPFKLNSNLNLITRYIIPIIDQRDIVVENSSQSGLGDATVSAFFAPSSAKGLIWGIGPALLIPIGTNEYLSTRKWGAGPTALILKQGNGLTYGCLVNQLWSYAGHEDRSDVNQLFFQPFFSKSWKSGASVGCNAEITANWENDQTTAFLNPSVSGITKLGKQAVSLVVGPRIPIAGSSESRPDFGIRAALTFVIPK